MKRRASADLMIVVPERLRRTDQERLQPNAACRIIRSAETTFRHPILALEERDGELC
jgi:hypothetical protein